MKLKLLVGLCTLILCGWLWPSLSEAAPFLNCGVSEPAINASANTMWCDDFESGHFYEPGTGALNKGWGEPRFPPAGTYPDPGGHAFARCKVATGAALVITTDPNLSIAGNCAATTGLSTASTACCNTPANSEHTLSQDVNFSNRDLYLRYYWKCVAAVQCSWSTNTKVPTTYLREFTDAGLGIGATGAFPLGMRPSGGNDYNFPPIKGDCGNDNCITDMHAFQSKVDPAHNWTGADRTFFQNVAGNMASGNDTGDCSVVPLHTCYEFGDNVQHWYYIEHHLRFNSAGGVADGVYEMWIDDCGVTGFTGGCATGGTLRARFTDVQHAADAGDYVGNLWFEHHTGSGSANNVGEWYFDQIVVSKVRIGPLGGIAPPTGPFYFHLNLNLRRVTYDLPDDVLRLFTPARPDQFVRANDAGR